MRCLHRTITGWPRRLELAGARRFTGSIGSRVASPDAETRCQHCYITFNNPAELAHHARNHCFPHNPAELLWRYPPGSRVVDLVTRSRGVVAGPASNPNMVHSRISVREDSGLVSDVPISRLQVVHGIRRFTEADRPNISRLQTSSWLNKYDQADSPEHLAGPLQEANASSWRTAIFGEREFVLVAESEWDWEVAMVLVPAAAAVVASKRHFRSAASSQYSIKGTMPGSTTCTYTNRSTTRSRGTC